MRRPYFLPIKRQVFNNIICYVYHTDRFQFGWYSSNNTVVRNHQKKFHLDSSIYGTYELSVFWCGKCCNFEGMAIFKARNFWHCVRELFVALLVWQFPIWFWSHLLLSGFSQLDYKVWSLFHSKIYLCQAHISLFQMWHDTLIAYKCSSLLSSPAVEFLKLHAQNFIAKIFFIAINQLSLNF